MRFGDYDGVMREEEVYVFVLESEMLAVVEHVVLRMIENVVVLVVDVAEFGIDVDVDVVDVVVVVVVGHKDVLEDTDPWVLMES
jgi:hypothetical protein